MSSNSPNSNWKPKDKIKTPFQKTVELDPGTTSSQEMYKLIIGSIVPRPIAFISTLGKKTGGNLAPFSFFNGVSSNPPCVMFSASVGKDGEKKDTLLNIEETGEFVVNSANEWLIEALVHCAAEYPHGVDEMEQVGLTPAHSVKVSPKRVLESAISLECKLYKTLQVGDGAPGSSTIVVGEIVYAHIAEHCYKDGKIMIEPYAPIGRLGGFGYGKLGQTFEIPVPRISID